VSGEKNNFGASLNKQNDTVTYNLKYISFWCASKVLFNFFTKSTLHYYYLASQKSVFTFFTSDSFNATFSDS